MRQASRAMASRTIIGSAVKLGALLRPGIKAGQRSKMHCRVPHPLERGGQVSFRAEPPPVPSLETSDEEKREFTLFEGGFFGNLFGPNPVAYVCQGTRTPADNQAPVLQDRVCTSPTGEKTPDGKPVTPCRFILTG